MSVPGMANSGAVLAGVGRLYVAALGVSWPAVTGTTLTWGAGWTEIDLTDGGWELQYKESTKGHTVDQQSMPVLYTADTAEGHLTVKMAAMQHAKLALTISNATVSVVPAASGTVGLSKMGVGGSGIKQFQLGVEGLSPENPAGGVWWELIQIWRAIPASTLSKKYIKGEKQMVEATWNLVADLTQAASEICFRITHQNAAALP